MPIVDQEKLVAAQFALAEVARRKHAKPLTPATLKERLLSEFSPKLHFLFEPHRYKVVYSGRYATKSWSFAAALLQAGYERRLRILCARETMKSIADSVHKLLEDQVDRLGLRAHYDVWTSSIHGKNGTEIFYAGLRNNISNIKSVEGCDVVWIEEAQSVSKHSWDTLIPTIRKAGSEVWVSWNPDLSSDETQKRFVDHPPPSARVVQISWRDNKYLNPMMVAEMEHLKATDEDDYAHVYEGNTRSTVHDAVYKAEIMKAEKNGQFCRVPYDARKPVDVIFDLGWGDLVSMWFMQTFPFDTRLIDYHEDSHKSMDHYLQVLQSKGYTYGQLIFPWDGGVKSVATGKSCEDVVKAKGYRVRVLRQGLVHDRIDAVRTMFSQLFFDATKCEVGLSHLRRYQWGPPGNNGTLKREPLHDQASHAADALGYAVLAIKTPPANKPAASLPNTRRSMGGSLSGFR